MKAAVLRAIPGDLEIADINIDTPGPREVLIKTAASGLCHSDLHFIDGKWRCPTPVVLGHESAGSVEAVGSLVTYVKPGDRVIMCVSVFCGYCMYCLAGRPALCESNEGRRAAGAPARLSQNGDPIEQFANLGSFAEKMLVHENAVVKIREDMPLDRAALIGCAVVTGIGSVVNTARVRAGSSVAVIGCGGVGLSAIQGARIVGAAQIIAVDVVASKLELAKKLGATEVVNPSEGDPAEQVRELSKGGVEYSFEAIGLKATAEQAFAMIRRGGVATVIGMIPVGQKVELDGSHFLQEKTIQGSSMGSNRFRIDMPAYVELYMQGRLNLDDMVSARIKLEEIADGFAAMKSGEIARDVILFEP